MTEGIELAPFAHLTTHAESRIRDFQKQQGGCAITQVGIDTRNVHLISRALLAYLLQTQR